MKKGEKMAVLTDVAPSKEFFDAAMRSDTKKLKKILKRHPEWAHKEQPHEAQTALEWTAAWGKLESVKVLVEFPLTNRHERQCAANALSIAASRGHLECVRAILPIVSAGSVDAMGRTPLMAAAVANRIECVQELLPVSDAGAADSNRFTALSLAIESKAWEIVDLLASTMSLQEAKKTRKKVSAEIGLPLCLAKIEQDELRKVMLKANGGNEKKTAVSKKAGGEEQTRKARAKRL